MDSVKTILVVGVFVFLAVTVWGQKTVHNSLPDMPIDEHTQLVTYKEVVQQKGSQDELYERALKWVNKRYSNPVAVIQKKDAVEGVIICVSNISIKTLSGDGKTFTGAGMVSYTLTIETKEERYRYIITDLYKKESSRFPIEKWFDTTKPEWSSVRYDHLHQIDEAVKKLIDNLKEGMQPEKIIIDEW